MNHLWTTEFITHLNQQIHTFENGVSVIVDRNFNTISKYHNDKRIEVLEIEKLSDTTEFLNYLEQTAIQSK